MRKITSVVLFLCLMWATLVMVSCTKTPLPLTPAPVVQPIAKPVDLTAIARGSQCAARSWKDRGKAPIGYFIGVAHSYARALCKPPGNASAALGSPEKDALAHYGFLKAPETDKARLKATYLMVIGLGLRESTGNFTCGRDYTAKGPQSASTGETGAWQFSFDSINATKEFKEIYAYYQAHPSECLKKEYSEGVKLKDNGYIGEGPGLAFQKFMRSCPAAQAEYTASGIRVLRKHWGPINRKEVELPEECTEMLTEIENAVVCS